MSDDNLDANYNPDEDDDDDYYGNIEDEDFEPDASDLE
jgi:hypothetical protein